MYRKRSSIKADHSGFTLLELTVVILVIMTLLGTGLFVSNQYTEWKLGRSASEKLRSVYAAQRMYLADHPTAMVNTITGPQIIPYLANRALVLPTVESLTGANLAIDVDVSPPVIDDGSGGVYDPSGATDDSLWDVGR